MGIDWNTNANWAEDTIGGDKVSNVFGLAWNVVVGAYTKFIIGADLGINAFYKVEMFFADTFQLGMRNENKAYLGGKKEVYTGTVLTAAAGGITRFASAVQNVFTGGETTVAEQRTSILGEDEIIAETHSISSTDSFHTCVSRTSSIAGVDSLSVSEHSLVAEEINQTAANVNVDGAIVNIGA